MIRSMTVADIGAVLEIEAKAYQSPWTAAMFGEELATESRRYLVIEDDGMIRGYGGLMLVGEEAHVITLAVDPAHHGRGHGSHLLRELFAVAATGGARHLTLEVRASNHPARGLYQRFGFQEVGVRKGYYGNEDAVIMFAHDISDHAISEVGND